MNITELSESIKDEIATRVKRLTKRIDHIEKEIALLSSEAVELHTFYKMAKRIPINDLAIHCNMKPTELNELIRAAKLTVSSPQLNRALLVRFGILK